MHKIGSYSHSENVKSNCVFYFSIKKGDLLENVVKVDHEPNFLTRQPQKSHHVKQSLITQDATQFWKNENAVRFQIASIVIPANCMLLLLTISP